MISTPALKAHLRAVPVPGEGALLLAEQDAAILRGRTYERIVPLIDGRRSADDIVSAVADTVEPSAAWYALLRLERGGHVVEGDPAHAGAGQLNRNEVPAARAMFRGTVRHTGVIDRQAHGPEGLYEEILARAAARRAGVPYLKHDALEGASDESTRACESHPEPVEERTAADGATADIRFTDVVSPYAPEEFFAVQADRPHPVLLRGPADRFADLVTWQDLDRLICSGRRAASQVRVVLDGEHIPSPCFAVTKAGPASGPFDQEIDDRKLISFLRQGATLIVDQAQRSLDRVADLAAAFERATCNDVAINLYASWQSARGFSTHWDDHDVFVVQVRGQKRWRIYGATRVAPLKFDVAAAGSAPKEPLWTGRLTAGDVLYVPRGWWHDARGDAAQGQANVHLTCSFRSRTGADILAWLRDRMTAHELFRRELPLLAGDDRWTEHVEAFRDLLESILREGTGAQLAQRLREEFRGRWTERAGPRFGSSLEPWRSGDWNDYRILLRGAPHAMLRRAEQEDSVCLTANGVKLELDPFCLPLIEPLAAGDTVTVAELKSVDTGRFDAAFVDDFIGELLSRAVVVAIAPQ